MLRKVVALWNLGGENKEEIKEYASREERVLREDGCNPVGRERSALY